MKDADYINRIIEQRLIRMAAKFPAVVLSGARQTGKSTLLKHLFPQRDMVVLDPVIDIANARKDPTLFLDNHPAPLIIDEIQYAPELTAAIKRRVDADRQPGMYILTGSQQWAVMKSVSDSLAGRAIFIHLDGFSLSEISRQNTADRWLKRYLESPLDFGAAPASRLNLHRTLYEQIWRGFLPEANTMALEWIGDFHKAYTRTYIERDARLAGDVNDWQSFGRFAQLMAALTAQEINHSQLGRELGITPQTASRWAGMLAATFQLLDAPAYQGNAIKRISGKPKSYIADTGLACSLQMISSPGALGGHPLAGALFETAVLGEIIKQTRTLSTPPNIYHWRTHGGAEVDILLERDGCFFPIEVKLTAHPTRNDVRGLAAFRATYPKIKTAPGLVIAPCERMERLTEHDFAVPWDIC